MNPTRVGAALVLSEVMTSFTCLPGAPAHPLGPVVWRRRQAWRSKELGWGEVWSGEGKGLSLERKMPRPRPGVARAGPRDLVVSAEMLQL
jgi:hypothetical protein